MKTEFGLGVGFCPRLPQGFSEAFSFIKRTALKASRRKNIMSSSEVVSPASATAAPSAATYATVNLVDYAEKHQADLTPPVCNRMIFNQGKLRIMIIGGPNQRKDYHLNLGEEIFFQLKGDMCLKTMECGEPKDVVIREGELFVLPGKIAHSPQRFENTLGVVVERARADSELDGLRYFVDETNQRVLWQRFFHVTDLGSQLVPLIKTYFASEAFATRQPGEGDVPPSAWEPDATSILPTPFALQSRYGEITAARPPLRLAHREFVVDLVTDASKTPSLPIETEVWVWLIDIEETAAEGDGEDDGAVLATPIGGAKPSSPVALRRKGDSVLCYEGLQDLSITRRGAKVLVTYTTGI